MQDLLKVTLSYAELIFIHRRGRGDVRRGLRRNSQCVFGKFSRVRSRNPGRSEGHQNRKCEKRAGAKDPPRDRTPE
ncbi:hypothetical protein EYF80_053620 [Liparis tanakae]|uniref:Uncharacterized protein n=1 Tax=Liparis tanakae TaxID=230148 RepID=A0A4Z2F4Z1_9TELE|nr:hypothetical protein EYF80_053620 [Liparis tanakae]